MTHNATLVADSPERSRAIVEVAPAAINGPRAGSLRRWNIALAALHALQGLLILALSLAKDPIAAAPVVSTYLAFDSATGTLVPAQRMLFELPIGLPVALFFFLSAAAHFSVAFPARRWYQRRLRSRPEPGPLDRVRVLVERHDRGHRGAFQGSRRSAPWWRSSASMPR